MSVFGDTFPTTNVSKWSARKYRLALGISNSIFSGSISRSALNKSVFMCKKKTTKKTKKKKKNTQESNLFTKRPRRCGAAKGVNARTHYLQLHDVGEVGLDVGRRTVLQFLL